MLASEQVIKFPSPNFLNEMARPSVATFFRDAHWGQCLELVSHLSLHGTQALLVIGPSGIGKTAMKYALENRQIPGLHLVDDAHNLSMDQALRLLHAPHQTILFARPEFLDRIKRCDLEADFAKHARVIEIEPLTFVEMQNFLLHHWQSLGHDGALPCKLAALQKIYALSHGIPGAAKQLFNDSLRRNAMLENTRGVTTRKRFSARTISLLVAAALAFGLFALARTQRAKPDAAIAGIAASAPQPTLATQVQQVQVEPALTPVADQAAQQDAQDQTLAQLEEKLVALQQQEIPHDATAENSGAILADG